MKMVRSKKGAIELSMSTIVILVLAMAMLILGLVLVKTIFSGATYNVDQINSKVKDQISQLFVGDQKMVIYLSNNQAQIQQGQNWGVAFLVKNTLRDTSTTPKFSYDVTMVENSCGLTSDQAMSLITLGKKSVNGVPIGPGDSEGWVIRFSLPGTTPLCDIRYNIEVTADNAHYESQSFDVSVLAK